MQSRRLGERVWHRLLIDDDDPAVSHMSYRYRHIIEDDVAAIARVHRDACLIAYKFMNWAYGEDETRAHSYFLRQI